jgi:hypothetical protein
LSQQLKKLEASLQEILAAAGQKDWDQLLPHPAWWESWQEQLLERWRLARDKKNLAHEKESTSLQVHEGPHCRKF